MTISSSNSVELPTFRPASNPYSIALPTFQNIVTFKGEWIYVPGGKSVKIVLPSLLKRIYPKRKDFAPLGSKFFPVSVDSF